jgi:mannitol 2-dehydrogenase
LVYRAPVVEHRSVLSLSDNSLGAIADRGIPVPTYDRSALAPRIVHVGVGGFHRAHLALYTDELARTGSDWGIRGLGLLPHDARMGAALAAQDHLYTLTEKGTGDFRPQVIGSIVDYCLAVDDSEQVAKVIADPATSIVSLTITEAGYAEPVDGQQTSCDVLAAALDRRRLDGGRPVTILSCDNLPGNGDVTRTAMLAAAGRRNDALVEWLQNCCTFPNSMVDRITPATADADRAWLLETHGIADRWPVVAEPFRQWVIEDRFAAERPAWDDVGVLFTDDVHQWELYKLRMLNAGHSCIAYLSALAGIVYVDEAMSTPVVRSFLEELLYNEALPTLAEIPGHPRQEYIRSVLDRFGNTGVRDQIARLCIDGTAKFPTFLIPTVIRQLEFDGPIQRGALALAGWARYLAVTPVAEQSFDASAAIARAHAARAVEDPTKFLDFAEVFPPDLRDNRRFGEAFDSAYRALKERGPLGAMMSNQ